MRVIDKQRHTAGKVVVQYRQRYPREVAEAVGVHE